MNYSQKEKTGRERERKGKIRVVLLMANSVFRKPWFLCSSMEESKQNKCV
jgi:hypothetical protein